MNHQEIAMEIKRDYEKIMATSILRLGDEYDKERRKQKIDKKRAYTKLYTIKTARKNNWIIVLGKAPSKEEYINTSSLTLCCVTYYYDQKGLKVLRWNPKGVVETFNGHLFTRYNERMQLEQNDIIEIVKHFFKRNRYMQPHNHLKNGTVYTIGYCKDGLILGETYPETFSVTWKTFISRDLVRPDQDEMEREIISELQREIMTGLNDPYKLFQKDLGKLDKLMAIKETYDED